MSPMRGAASKVVACLAFHVFHDCSIRGKELFLCALIFPGQQIDRSHFRYFMSRIGTIEIFIIIVVQWFTIHHSYIILMSKH